MKFQPITTQMDCEMWGCRSGDYSYVISRDLRGEELGYRASCKGPMDRTPRHFPENPFPSFGAAEARCRQHSRGRRDA